MTTRREVLVTLGTAGLAAPLACFAQQQQRSTVARIGLLETNSPSASARWRDALTTRLRELGLFEGTHEARARDQPQDCQGNGPDDFARTAVARRQGDRMIRRELRVVEVTGAEKLPEAFTELTRPKAEKVID
jgi:hypothetical protein